MSEANITRGVMAYLRSVPHILVLKLHGGRYQTAGLPDLLVVKEGRAYFLEVKAPGKKPTKLQRATMDLIARSGAVVKIVSSVEDVKEVIER